jgi:hypothetical protein
MSSVKHNNYTKAARKKRGQGPRKLRAALYAGRYVYHSYE